MKKKMKKTLIIFFLVLTSVMFTYQVSSSDTYYVSTTTGNDNNTGTLTEPFKTIQKAADIATAGDTVNIREGTYYEEVFFKDKHGTNNALITIQAYNNENVIVDGRNIPNKWNHSIIKTTNTSYLRITGLTLSNSAFCGIWINALANWITIDNNTITNCSSNGFYTETSTPYTITHISFTHNIVDNVNNNWSGNGSTFNEAVTFRNVQYFDISYNHISRCGKECLDAKHGSAYGTIHHNTIDTSTTLGVNNYNHIGIYIDAFNEHDHDITIYNNYVYGSNGSGIAVGVEQPTGSLDNIRIYNNIIDVTWISACGILIVNWGTIQDEPISDISIYCNTVLSGSFALYLQADNLTENIRIENNIFMTVIPTILNVKNYNPTPIIILRNNLYYTTTDVPRNEWNGTSNLSWGDQAILQDPLLKSDYKLQRGSPAIDHGYNIPLLDDYWGNHRPRGTTYDIGAYEYPLSNPPPANKPPIADLTAGGPYLGFTNEPINFNGSRSNDPDGNVTNWIWDFGDNTTGIGKITTHGYITPGTYQITLTVFDDQNATNSTTTTCQINRHNKAPTIPTITGPRNGTTNITYTFTVLSTDPENDTIRYTISWDDETLDTTTSDFLPNNTSFTYSHIWMTPGVYNITVIVTDNQTESTAQFSITIEAEPKYNQQTPGFELIIVFYAIILTMALPWKKQKK